MIKGNSLEHFIQIAEMKVIQGPGVLKTVVGSCIALCIWDKVKKMGGMVHIMMPRSKNKPPLSEGKYADGVTTCEGSSR